MSSYIINKYGDSGIIKLPFCVSMRQLTTSASSGLFFYMVQLARGDNQILSYHVLSPNKADDIYIYISCWKLASSRNFCFRSIFIHRKSRTEIFFISKVSSDLIGWNFETRMDLKTVFSFAFVSIH